MKTHACAAQAFLATSLCLAPLPAASQLSHAEPGSGGSVEIAVARPFFEMDGDYGAATGVLLARAVVPSARDNVSLFAEWGVSHGTYAGTSSTTTSNLALGAAFGSAEATSGSITVSLPVAHESGDDDFATGVGLFTDPDHLERFFPDVWGLEAAVLSRRRLDSGSMMGIRVAGTVLGSRQGGDTELYARYSAFGRVPAGNAHLGAELSGVAILSEDNLDAGERTFHHLAVFAGLPDAGGAPELYVRIPMDSDFNDVVKAVVGLRVRF